MDPCCSGASARRRCSSPGLATRSSPSAPRAPTMAGRSLGTARGRHRALPAAPRVLQPPNRCRLAGAPALDALACWAVERRGERPLRPGKGTEAPLSRCRLARPGHPSSDRHRRRRSRDPRRCRHAAPRGLRRQADPAERRRLAAMRDRPATSPKDSPRWHGASRSGCRCALPSSSRSSESSCSSARTRRRST